MSKINFRNLVESLLFEKLIDDLTPPKSAAGVEPIPGGIDQVLIKAEKYAFEQGKYEKNDTVLSFKTAWPYIDVLGFLYKTLVDNKITTADQNGRQLILSILNNSSVNTAEDFFSALPNTIQLPQNADQLAANVQQKINTLKRDGQNYRDYFITRFKQLNDKTAILAAEPYLNKTPYIGISTVLKEFGGYDLNQVNNILYYPGETKFTQQNIEGPVMSIIVELSKLMLLFYREYIIDQKEKDGFPIAPSVAMALGLVDERGNGNIEKLRDEVQNSAGKQNVSTPAGRVIQQDYIKFINGNSALTIDPSEPPPTEIPLNPPKPLIHVIKDFQGMTDTGQLIYQTFLELFNSIKQGTLPTTAAKIKSTISKIAGAAGALDFTMGAVN